MTEFIKNTIIGFVVADALGVPVEFSSRESLNKNPLNDMIGYGTYNMPEGSWSDDSSMTLITLDVLSKYGLNYDKLMNDFIKWYNEGYMTPTDKLFDIGIATSNALHKRLANIPSLLCGGSGEYDNGNGSLMRIYPFAILCLNKDKQQKQEIIFNASSLTHSHDISKWGCLLLTEYYIKIINGIDKFTAYLELCDEFINITPKCYNRLLSKKIHLLNIDEIKSSGFIVDTIEAVFYTFLNNTNYKDTVLSAINLGGDTDTIGAIVGGLSGAYFKDIPNEWINKLKKLDLILDIINNFTNYIYKK